MHLSQRKSEVYFIPMSKGSLINQNFSDKGLTVFKSIDILNGYTLAFWASGMME